MDLAILTAPSTLRVPRREEEARRKRTFGPKFVRSLIEHFSTPLSTSLARRRGECLPVRVPLKRRHALLIWRKRKDEMRLKM